MNPPLKKLEFETIGSCNRVCGTCLRQTTPYTALPTHANRFPIATKIGQGMKMSMDMIKDIVEQAKDISELKSIYLSHYNEPLLDDRFPEIARYIREQMPKMDIRACTNFDLMTEDLAKELDGVVSFFHVSLYYEDPVYSKRKKLVESWFKKTTLNIHYKGHAEDYHMTTHFSPREERLKAKIKAVQHNTCTRYNAHCIIAYDGTFLHCCEDYNGNFDLGNVKDTTILEMWESETHQGLVEDLKIKGGRRMYKHCIDCPDMG